MPAVSFRLFKPSPAWMGDHRVKCRGLDPALFYPNNPKESVRVAKSICNGDPRAGTSPCHFRQECLNYALDEHEQFGVWGGTSERERRRIWKARRMVVTAVQVTIHEGRSG